ncbi:hypothetical protein H6784_00345 [Candidatus Nomurabacteria bacterium]|nr:hypothetical protein [Candidatus Kaiserbacteria bacterium]MCB9813842.1 hypothetical protein [Candidatus Nomurabacteria bacterium]
MKIIKCYNCDLILKAKTKQEMLNQLYLHYMSEHEKVILGADTTKKKLWMEKFNKDWSEAPKAE